MALSKKMSKHSVSAGVSILSLSVDFLQGDAIDVQSAYQSPEDRTWLEMWLNFKDFRVGIDKRLIRRRGAGWNLIVQISIGVVQLLTVSFDSTVNHAQKQRPTP